MRQSIRKWCRTGLLLAVGVWMLQSCQPKSRVDELRDLVEQVAQEGGTYTEAQWENVNNRFSELLDGLGECDDLTQEELNEVARLQGQYAAEAFKRYGRNFRQEFEKARQMFDGFMEGLSEDSTMEAD